MAYTIEEKNECFNWIISEIESGKSLISAINTNGMPSTSTFYIWLEEEPEKSKRYTRACEARELLLFDEILSIADKQDKDVDEVDGIEVINHNVINRNRLQIDARKWVLGKMNPKKYGEKIDMTSDGEKVSQVTIFQLPDNGRK
ncbi:MAG: hypothetical protein V4497_09375 [Bacteroidota bacterium]